MTNKTYNNFKEIVLRDIHLIDVRAPIEYEKGAFLHTANLPIMNNEERKKVGICYKEKGSEAAVALGHQLVCGKVKEERVKAWGAYIEKYPDAMIYCFRGGMRSMLSQQWIKEELHHDIIRLKGGYKAFRNYLLSELQPEALNSKPLILGGCTGAGKTIVLKQLENAIDLEGIANHRGSSFGNQATPQPTQIDFENNLAYALIKHKQKNYHYMILEDEGKNVGRCYLPKDLAAYFRVANLVIMDVPLEKRIDITMDEYVYQSQKIYRQMYGEDLGITKWADYIKFSIEKIKKRLGGVGYIKVMGLFMKAYQEQIEKNSFIAYKEWIMTLLKDYYDPMYQYQIKKTTKNIVFRGDTKEVLAYLKEKK